MEKKLEHQLIALDMFHTYDLYLDFHNVHLKNSIDKINTQNLLRLRSLTNDQAMTVTNSLSDIARTMIK